MVFSRIKGHQSLELAWLFKEFEGCQKHDSFEDRKNYPKSWKSHQKKQREIRPDTRGYLKHQQLGMVSKKFPSFPDADLCPPPRNN